MASIQPMPQGQHDKDRPFLNAVHDFCKLIQQVGNPEAKFAAFLFESALYQKPDGSWDYDASKVVSFDEIMVGFAAWKAGRK